MKVEIYTIKNDRNCEKAKVYLNKKKVSYKEIDVCVNSNSKIQQKMKDFKKMRITYPVTLILDEGGIIPIQGFHKDEFDRMFNSWTQEYDLEDFDDVEDVHNIPYTLKQRG